MIDKKQKIDCQKKLGIAISKGVLLRPDKCEMCGDESNRIIAHHSDYNYPLKVKWLCVSCHTHIHNKKKEKDKCSSRLAIRVTPSQEKLLKERAKSESVSCSAIIRGLLIKK